MAEELNFLVTYENNKGSLQKIKKEFETQMGKLRANIQAEPAGKGAKGGGYGLRPKLQGKISAISQEVAKSQERLANITRKRVSTVERIIELQSRGASITTKENNELKKLIAQTRGSAQALAGTQKYIVKLNTSLQQFQSILADADAAVKAFKEAGGSLSSENFDGLTRLNEAAINVSNAAKREYNSIIQVSDRRTALAAGFAKLNDELLKESSSLQKFGLTANDQSLVLEAAMKQFKNSLERAGVSLSKRLTDAEVVKGGGRPELQPAFGKKTTAAAKGAVASEAIQEKELQSNIDRLKGRIVLWSDELQKNIIVGQTLRAELGKSTRISEDYVRAASPLAKEFGEQAEAIRKSSSATRPLTNAQLNLIGHLNKSAKDLAIMSRPTIEVANRSRELSLRYGKGAQIIDKFISSSNLDKVEAGRLNDVISRFGDDLVKIAQTLAPSEGKIVGDTGELRERTSAETADAVRQQGKIVAELSAALREEAESAGVVADKNKTLARSLEKLSATERVAAGNKTLAAEQNKVREELAALAPSMKELARDTQALGGKEEDFAIVLNDALSGVRESIGESRLDELSRIGPGAQKVRAAFDKLAGVFETEFLGAAKKAAVQLDKQTQRDNELNSQLSKAREDAADATRETVKNINKQLSSTDIQNTSITQLLSNALIGSAKKAFGGLKASSFATVPKTAAKAIKDTIGNTFRAIKVDKLEAELNDTKNNIRQLGAEATRLGQSFVQAGANEGSGTSELLRVGLLKAEIVKKQVKIEQATNVELERQTGLTKRLNEVKRQQLSTDQRRLQDSQGGGGAAGGGGGGGEPPKFGGLKDIKKFGATLDSSGLEKFINLLKQEGTTIQKVNTQLKAHQGNIAKSNVLVDNLTKTMTSGQKAAFQFGFAAANAAERLAAWASPAALIFQAVGSLKNALSELIKFDEQTRRIAFFQPGTLEEIGGSIGQVTEAIREQGNAANLTAKSLGLLGSQNERVIAISSKGEGLQKALLKRSIETGLALDSLTEAALITARVGRTVFSDIDSGQVDPFFEAVEALIRIEGGSADASRAVALMNSVLNQFALEGEDATAVMGNFVKAAGETQFGALQLAEAIARSGGALSQIQGATFEEALALVQSGSARTIPSVAKLGTALRQLSTIVADNADVIEEFSGIELTDEGQIGSMRELAKVLLKINELQRTTGGTFLAGLVSERDTRSILLSLASGAEEFAGRLDELSDSSQVTAEALINQSNAFALNKTLQDDMQSSLTRLSNVLVSFVKSTEIQGFLQAFTDGASTTVLAIQDIIGVASKFGGIFAILAGIAAPTLNKIAAGFTSGFIAGQNKHRVIADINIALQKEQGLVEATNLAEREGFIGKATANKFRLRGLIITAKLTPLLNRQKVLNKEIEIIQKQTGHSQELLNKKKAEQILLEQQILKAQRGQEIQNKKLIADVQGRGQFRAAASKYGTALGSAIGITLGSYLVSAANDSAEEAGTTSGKQLAAAFEGAVSGGITGGILGGAAAIPAAAIGAVIGGLVNVARVNSQIEKSVKEQAKAAERANKTFQRQSKQLEERQQRRLKTAGVIDGLNQNGLVLTSKIEKLQLKIQKVGEAKAEDLGYLLQLSNAQLKLQQVQFQLGAREKEQLKETLAIEKEILRIKQSGAVLEQQIKLARDAALQSVAARASEELQARISLKFDDLSIKNEFRTLQKELSQKSIELATKSVQTGTTTEQRKLTREIEKIKNKEVLLNIKQLRAQFQASRAISEGAKKDAEEQIKAWQTAAGLVVKSFATVFSAQQAIASVIGEQLGIQKTIFSDNLSKLESSISRDKSLSEDAREQRSAAARRLGIQGELAATRKIFNQQRDALGKTVNAEELAEKTNLLVVKIREIEQGLGRFRQNIDQTGEKEIEKVRIEEELLKLAQNRARAQIQLEQKNINAVNDLRRQEIESIGAVIDSQKKRIELEEEAGRKLLEAPEEFLKGLQSIVTAQDFFEGIGDTDFGNLGGLEDRIRKLQAGGQGGFGNLQAVNKGLEAAAEQNVQLVKNLSPENLLSVFRRLQLASAKDVNEISTQEDRQIAAINTLQARIQDDNNRLFTLNSNRKKIEEEVKLVAEVRNSIAERQEEALDGISNALIVNAVARAAEFEKNRAEIAKTEGAILKVLGAVDETKDIQTSIKVGVETSVGLLAEIAAADDKVLKNRRFFAKQQSQITSLLKNVIPKDLADEFKTFTPPRTKEEGVFKSAKQNRKTLEDIIKRIEGGEDLSKSGFGKADVAQLKAFLGFTDRELSSRKAFGSRFGVPVAGGTKRDQRIEIPTGGLFSGSRKEFRIPTSDIESFFRGRGLALGEHIPGVGPGESRFEAERNVPFGPGQKAILDKAEAFARREEFTKSKLQELSGSLEDYLSQMPKGVQDGLRSYAQKQSGITDEELALINKSGLDVMKAILGKVDTPSDATTAPPEVSPTKKDGIKDKSLEDRRQAAIDALYKSIETAKEIKRLADILDAQRRQQEAAAKQAEAKRAEEAKIGPQELQEILKNYPKQGEPEPVRVRQESIDNMKESIQESFRESTDDFMSRLDEQLNKKVNVDIADVNVQLNANVIQQIQGQEFADQLVAAFQGTGLEDKVAEVQSIVGRLVKTRIDRGEIIPGADIIDFANDATLA